MVAHQADARTLTRPRHLRRLSDLTDRFDLCSLLLTSPLHDHARRTAAPTQPPSQPASSLAAAGNALVLCKALLNFVSPLQQYSAILGPARAHPIGEVYNDP